MSLFPDPSALNKATVSLAVLFSVAILLAVFLAVIFTIHWQKKQKQKAAKTETLSGDQIKWVFFVCLFVSVNASKFFQVLHSYSYFI